MERPVLQVEAGLRWYAIQSKPNKEKEVERRLTDLSLEVFLPWMRTRRRIGSRHQWVLVPLFASYLFCRLDLVESGKAARYSPGVKDFLKFGSHITEVGVEIITTLRARCLEGVAKIEPLQMKAGEPVRIKEGP